MNLLRKIKDIYENDIDMVAKADKKVITLAAPCDGNIYLLSQSKDQMFREEVLGKGCFIYPESEIICSPIKGKIVALFPTNHAIGIEGQNGENVLLHVGINTIEMNGEGFYSFVNKGDLVESGDKLLSVDIKTVIKKGYIPDVYIIITNVDKFNVLPICTRKVHSGDELFKISY